MMEKSIKLWGQWSSSGFSLWTYCRWEQSGSFITTGFYCYFILTFQCSSLWTLPLCTTSIFYYCFIVCYLSGGTRQSRALGTGAGPRAEGSEAFLSSAETPKPFQQPEIKQMNQDSALEPSIIHSYCCFNQHMALFLSSFFSQCVTVSQVAK